MYKFLVFIILSVTYCSGTVIKAPAKYNKDFLLQQSVFEFDDVRELDLISHVMDFLNLVELENVMGVIIEYMQDPEVTNFLNFVLSPKFNEIIWEVEKMEEFKEVYMYLSMKGYDIESVIDFINTVLELPAFEKPRSITKPRSLSGFIAAMAEALPLTDMKKLFEEKLEDTSEFSELFDTLNSSEFIDIIKRMSKSPKMMELKTLFESYGVDFSLLCKIIKEIMGERYQGVFCEDSTIVIVN